MCVAGSRAAAGMSDERIGDRAARVVVRGIADRRSSRLAAGEIPARVPNERIHDLADLSAGAVFAMMFAIEAAFRLAMFESAVLGGPLFRGVSRRRMVMVESALGAMLIVAAILARVAMLAVFAGVASKSVLTPMFARMPGQMMFAGMTTRMPAVRSTARATGMPPTVRRPARVPTASSAVSTTAAAVPAAATTTAVRLHRAWQSKADRCGQQPAGPEHPRFRVAVADTLSGGKRSLNVAAQPQTDGRVHRTTLLRTYSEVNWGVIAARNRRR